MANVLPSSIGFHSRPHKDAPTFGFGLSPSMNPTQWPSSVPIYQPTPFNQFTSNSNHSSTIRSQKRRHDSEDGSENSQDAMDRSPTPDRPKRGLAKRARISPNPSETSAKDEKGSKEDRIQSRSEQDIDVGVLLARLPPQTLLPILTALIEKHPTIKHEILPLIPAPTVEIALQVLAAAAKKLREAYPHSNATPFQSPNPLSFGFGFSSPSTSMQPNMNSQVQNTGMRDSYVLSRIRPALAEFVSAFSTYMPYFSILESYSIRPSSHASRPAQLHPHETFQFLSAVTTHVCSQPLLVQSALESDLQARLAAEWNAWVGKLDTIVNHEAGMFGSEMASSWIRQLDNYADSTTSSSWVVTMFKNVRDNFVMRVGWLVQRTHQYRMEES
ncbi:hypothetical protein K435DRAFT_265890 [Dendrothele bispora CBS 962.96]|uniref:Tethering factor for nuclear proteasome STS1 n=1 Tax=Dendrothele bispora (strain CBS 962.96) TaxID=1314807 RepID=A0A4S8MWI1_DENBC|nr:hypothetical protein K435DRAFT_265890 [Dendrothele bispora CBS 962.96]